MSKHTPGPWVESELMPGCILSMDRHHHDLIADLAHNPNSDADAALISAAPELLAALKAVVTISDRKHIAWEAAKAAIAKAEGGAA